MEISWCPVLIVGLDVRHLGLVTWVQLATKLVGEANSFMAGPEGLELWASLRRHRGVHLLPNEYLVHCPIV